MSAGRFLLLAVIGAGLLFYFHVIPADFAERSFGSRQASPGAVTPAPQITQPPVQPPPPPGAAMTETGICYLTMPVQVPNQYGKITYQQGAVLRYIGALGGRLIVAQGNEEFTVRPDMVTDTLAAALGAAPPPAQVTEGLAPVASGGLPQATMLPSDPAAPLDLSNTGGLSR
jgi:hypothetical protein